jgi:DNA-binding NarL/FixJ family response regulator
VKPIRILVVATDPNARAAEVNALRALPDVELLGPASGGADAMRRVSRHHPDLVLMDLLMPRRSGLQVGATLKRRAGGPRVVLVSLGSGAEFARAAHEFGIDAVVRRDDIPGKLPSLIERLFPERGPAKPAPPKDKPR